MGLGLMNIGKVQDRPSQFCLHDKQAHGPIGLIARLFLGLLVVALALGIVGCQKRKTEILPDEVFGVWITEDPRYEHRFFEISKVSIVFGTGPESAEAYMIARVEKVPSDDTGVEQFILFYENDVGKEYQLSFLYEPGNDTPIRFLHDRGLAWKKLLTKK